jgi:hypothetical protein
MARRPGQIPLDDEPADIDLDDLPSDAELEEAERAEAEADAEGDRAEAAEPPQERSLLGLFQLWFSLVVALYLAVGLLVGALFAFRGAAGVGLDALGHPRFYLLILFWPVALWQLLLGQL